jgi:ArsR family transcriptional regulator
VESRYNESKKFYEKFDSTPRRTGKALTHLQSNLTDIEDEISNLESRLNDLRALKQLTLEQLHQIGRESFEGHLERELLYNIVEDRGRRKKERNEEKEFNRKRISRLAETLNENESHIKDAMVRIANKLEKNTAKILFGDLS